MLAARCGLHLLLWCHAMTSAVRAGTLDLQFTLQMGWKTGFELMFKLEHGTHTSMASVQVERIVAMAFEPIATGAAALLCLPAGCHHSGSAAPVSQAPCWCWTGRSSHMSPSLWRSMQGCALSSPACSRPAAS